MSIMGYYDGTAVQVNKPLQINQKVIIIPIESDDDWGNLPKADSINMLIHL